MIHENEKNIGSSPCFGDGTFDDFLLSEHRKGRNTAAAERNRLSSQQKCQRRKTNRETNRKNKGQSGGARQLRDRMGMLELLEQNEKGEAANDYQVTLATAPDEVVAKVVSGELDIAAVPTNVAATLYNKTQGGVQLAALNTMGVLYIVEAGEASSRWQTSRVRPSTPPDKALHRSMPSIWCWKRTG